VYSHPLIKGAVIVACAGALWYSPQYPGWLWTFDAWFSAGFRGLPPDVVRRLLFAALLAVLAADLLGARPPAFEIRLYRPVAGMVLLFLASAAVFWLLRVHRWQGDLMGSPGSSVVDGGSGSAVPLIEMGEPLGSYLFHYTVKAGVASGLRPSQAVQIETVLYGAGAMVALALWARDVSTQPGLVFFMIAASGYIVLFCGFPERGTPKALALNFWYVYAATRALTSGARRWGVAASGLLGLTGLMHGSGFCWLPAHAFSVWRLPGWRYRVLAVVSFLVPIGVLALCIRAGPAIISGGAGNTLAPLSWTASFPPFSWTARYCRGPFCGYPFFTLDHAFNVVSTLLVLAPMATLCLPEAVWRSRSLTERWLLGGALGWLFLSVIWYPIYGFVGDWDIFALTPYVISCWTAYVAATQLRPDRFRRFAFTWIALAGTHAISWWRPFGIPW
jgi:hypothetical protein